MKPVLLLIPGLLSATDVWRGVTAELGGEADVRVVDVTTQSSIVDMASDAHACIADVPADTRLVVCGHSMGGYVAMEMLEASGRRPDAIALLSTSARPESDEGRAMREKTIAAIGRDFERVIQGIASFGAGEAMRDDADRMRGVVDTMRRVGPDAAIRQNRAAVARGDRRETLSQVRIPALVVCGREDRVISPAMSEELAALIPDSRLEWIEGAGHLLAIENPKQVASLLRTLL